jgi:hypothetical protein
VTFDPPQIAYMLVSLGYDDEAIIEAIPELDRDSTLELVGMARTERATNLAEQDEAIEVERQAARESEWNITTEEDDADSEGDRRELPRARGV